MGLIFSRFYDKPSTRDTLEKIEQEIQNIEERRWDKIKREQFVVQILSFIPITILIVTICILIYPSESSIRDKLVLCIPIIIFNLILWMCRRSVQWYSRWSLDNEEARLRKLQKEKKKILEMVCETESYRVAAELLEKYDPKQLRRRERPSTRPSSPLETSLTKFTASPNRGPSSQQQHNLSIQHSQHNTTSHLNQSINFAVPPLQPSAPAPPPPTPMAKTFSKSNQANTTISSNHNNSIVSPVAASSVQGRPVRPILSKDRSLFERMVDWVVADGPDNRFALICRYCYGHNGMSLAEEYETINFRCCYCYNLNTTSNKKKQLRDQLQPDREKSNFSAKAKIAEEDNTVTEQKGDETLKEDQCELGKEDAKNGIQSDNTLSEDDEKKESSSESSKKSKE